MSLTVYSRIFHKMCPSSEVRNTQECVYRKVETETLYLTLTNSRLASDSQINIKNEDEHNRNIKCLVYVKEHIYVGELVSGEF